ncbi:MAG: hypothetical protein A2283_05030 [Lentisphaerae bacterium RIFOXYA12_FULL_48_11]|nr:MAG: hypothetical protein A2283_05030 [Lentisphaerae bacterium RIFOXYA12_FULL_48_11]
MSAGAPAKWTGMISLVRSVTADLIAAGEVMSVSRSTSTKTGFAPASTMRFTVETQVIDGVITSSPGPIPKAVRMTCIPAVAEAMATASWHPVYLRNSFSNSVFLGPVVIHPDRRTSFTALMSWLVIEGRENGRNSFLTDLVTIFHVNAVNYFACVLAT